MQSFMHSAKPPLPLRYARLHGAMRPQNCRYCDIFIDFRFYNFFFFYLYLVIKILKFSIFIKKFFIMYCNISSFSETATLF